MEFEVTFVPSDAFLLDFNLRLLDTGYDQIGPRVTSGHLPLTTSTEFQLAPEETWSVGFQHNGNLRGGATLTSRLDVMYQGQFGRNEPFCASMPIRPCPTVSTRAATGQRATRA